MLLIKPLAVAFAALLAALRRSSLYGAVRRKEKRPFSMSNSMQPVSGSALVCWQIAGQHLSIPHGFSLLVSSQLAVHFCLQTREKGSRLLGRPPRFVNYLYMPLLNNSPPNLHRLIARAHLPAFSLPAPSAPAPPQRIFR